MPEVYLCVIYVCCGQCTWNDDDINKSLMINLFIDFAQFFSLFFRSHSLLSRWYAAGEEKKSIKTIMDFSIRGLSEIERERVTGSWGHWIIIWATVWKSRWMTASWKQINWKSSISSNRFVQQIERFGIFDIWTLKWLRHSYLNKSLPIFLVSICFFLSFL